MNMKDTDGADFLEAAAKGKKDDVKYMLEKGTKIDDSGVRDGYTALAEAAPHGQDDVVKLLLDHGANAAPKCISSSSKFRSKDNIPLSLAAGKGHLGSLRLLLDAHTYETADLKQARIAAKNKNRLDAMKLLNERERALH